MSLLLTVLLLLLTAATTVVALCCETHTSKDGSKRLNRWGYVLITCCAATVTLSIGKESLSYYESQITAKNHAEEMNALKASLAEMTAKKDDLARIQDTISSQRVIDTERPIVVRSLPKGQIKGKVVDFNQNPLEDVEVQMEAEGGQEPDTVVLTKVDGSYSLSVPERKTVGGYHVHVSWKKAGYETKAKYFDRSEGYEVLVVLPKVKRPELPPLFPTAPELRKGPKTK